MTNNEYQTHGRFAHGEILRMPDGSRHVRLKLHDGRCVTAESQKVDLKAANASTLKEALDKACHKLGFLPLFEKIEIRGPLALVNCYRRPADPSFGWANIIKRGVPPLKFALSRIDLEAMCANNVEDALRKVAFDTGTIKIQSA